MITRLRISGFKNLVDVDIRFGPFTCIAGPNGIGKSNLFDAIRFLSATADLPLQEAVRAVRETGNKSSGGEVRDLFTRTGKVSISIMSFEVYMIVPREGVDDLGQHAQATSNLLKYNLDLKLREKDEADIEIVREELTRVAGSPGASLLFPHNRHWLSSVVTPSTRQAPFISTSDAGGEARVLLHTDPKSGKPFPRLAKSLPRTVLSAANAAESPTVLLARNELRSWMRLQLEPACLRQVDSFDSKKSISYNGSHLPATLARLVGTDEDGAIEASVTNRLFRLLSDIRSVKLTRDEARQYYSISVEDRDGTVHQARALSDGTLRFLALSILAEDSAHGGVLCLEEPENGIHPARIEAMVELIRGDLSMDCLEAIGSGNPFRQIIINTHSPLLVNLVPLDDLVVAEPYPKAVDGKPVASVSYSVLPRTWREQRIPEEERNVCGFIRVLDYLGVRAVDDLDQFPEKARARAKRILSYPEIKNALGRQLKLL